MIDREAGRYERLRLFSIGLRSVRSPLNVV
jgi:hypothetical protein